MVVSAPHYRFSSRLGARLDIREVKRILVAIEGPQKDRERVTMTFMSADIVTSTDLVGLIGDEKWEALLAWHDRALRKPSPSTMALRSATPATGSFVSFDRGIDAVEAAVAIQRLLAEHSRDQGFAPSVRIGIHTDEATVDGSDYRGLGVHRAARVSATAEGDEIVASAAALEAADALRFPFPRGGMSS